MEVAAAAINFGASDLDGTIGQEKIAHAALAHGKHVLCEKPLCESSADAAALVALRLGANIFWVVILGIVLSLLLCR